MLIRKGAELSPHGRFMNLNLKTNTFLLVLILVATGPLFRRALAIRRGDPNRLTEAECLVALGQACRNQLKYADAEKYLLEAREIVDTKLGRGHPLDAVCQLYLAQLYQEQQDYAKAV